MAQFGNEGAFHLINPHHSWGFLRHRWTCAKSSDEGMHRLRLGVFNEKRGKEYGMEFGKPT